MTPEELEAVVEGLEGDSRRIAARFAAPGTSEHSELAQEALVAMWQALQKYPGKEPAYYAMAGRNRLLSIVVHQTPMLGSSEAGHAVHSRPQLVPATSTSSETAPYDSFIEYLLGGADLVEGVELAYHRGELARAINDLHPDDRAYVYHRFWLGTKGVEIDAMLGLPYGKGAQRWNRRIRPKLAEALAHLVAA